MTTLAKMIDRAIVLAIPAGAVLVTLAKASLALGMIQ